MSKAVTKTEANLPSAAMPEWMQEYRGEGKEDIDKNDVIMPRMKLCQAMTPEVKNDKIAQEGDFLHTITNEVLCKVGEKIQVIPIVYQKEYIIWYDRKGPNKGGIAARAKKVVENGVTRYKWDRPHEVIEDKIGGSIPVKYELQGYVDEDGLNNWGTQIPGDEKSPPAATEHHTYVLMLPEHDNEMVAVSLSKTGNRPAKTFNSVLRNGDYPTYARIYELESFPDHRDDNTFANWKFSRHWNPIQDKELFMSLRELHQSLKEKNIALDDEIRDEVEEPSDNDAF